MDKCEGEHELYVAECVAIEKEGKLVVITVCRHCDMVNFHEKIIAHSHTPIQFIKKEN